jgi:nicotinamidase-related amidase
MAMAAKRAVGKLRPEHTAFLLCDIQDKFRTLMYNGETIIKTASYMTSVAKLLDIPIVATEQYSKVFGRTVDDCFADPEDRKSTPTFEKKIFSMMCGPEMDAHLETLGRSTYVLFGIETHVCVQQTALDLLEKGHEVHIIVDGVSSQQPIDRDIALQRLSQAGAWLTTAQSATFMLMQSAEHKRFKKVSRLTVEHMKLHNEFNDAFKTSIKKEEMEAEA